MESWIAYERLVNADHTFSYENKRYKLDPGHFRTLRKKTITIHEYKDINFKVFYAGQEITFTEVKLALGKIKTKS